MRLAFKAVALGVAFFVVIQVLSFVAGLVLLLNTQHLDPNGITSSPDRNVEAALATWNGLAVVFGALIAFAVALAWWIVQSVRRPHGA